MKNLLYLSESEFFEYIGQEFPSILNSQEKRYSSLIKKTDVEIIYEKHEDRLKRIAEKYPSCKNQVDTWIEKSKEKCSELLRHKLGEISNQKKTLDPDAKSVLTKYFLELLPNPYPTPMVKKHIAKEANIEVSQVNNCYAV